MEYANKQTGFGDNYSKSVEEWYRLLIGDALFCKWREMTYSEPDAELVKFHSSSRQYACN